MGTRAKCHPHRTTRLQLNTLLSEDPRLSLDQLAVRLKVTTQRVRTLAKAEGWEMEWDVHWEHTTD